MGGKKGGTLTTGSLQDNNHNTWSNNESARSLVPPARPPVKNRDAGHRTAAITPRVAGKPDNPFRNTLCEEEGRPIYVAHKGTQTDTYTQTYLSEIRHKRFELAVPCDARLQQREHLQGGGGTARQKQQRPVGRHFHQTCRAKVTTATNVCNLNIRAVNKHQQLVKVILIFRDREVLWNPLPKAKAKLVRQHAPGTLYTMPFISQRETESGEIHLQRELAPKPVADKNRAINSGRNEQDRVPPAS